MIGVFIFEVKPTKDNYIWKKTPKIVLEADDVDIVKNRQHYFLHHIDGDEIDNMSDIEIVNYMNTNYNYNVTLPQKKTKKGYADDDKKHYIRIVRQNKEWFQKLGIGR